MTKKELKEIIKNSGFKKNRHFAEAYKIPIKTINNMCSGSQKITGNTLHYLIQIKCDPKLVLKNIDNYFKIEILNKAVVKNN